MINTYSSTIAMAMAAAVFAACSETPTTPSPHVDASAVVGEAHLSPEAVILATGGTQQLTLTATTLDGTPLTSYDTVRYTSADSSKVTVSPTGLVTARTGSRAVTDGPVSVVATVVKGGVTRSDTAYFAVLAMAGTAPTFSLMDPPVGYKVPVTSTQSVTPSITYFDGVNTVTLDPFLIPIKIHVEQPALARRVMTSSFAALAPAGEVTVSATTVVFGTPLTATVTYTLGDPISAVVRLYRARFALLQGLGGYAAGFPPSTVFYLQTGGMVELSNWADIGTHTVGLTCTASEGGVAPPPVTGIISEYGSGFMVFTTPGRYACDWTSDGVPDFPTDGSLHFSVVVR